MKTLEVENRGEESFGTLPEDFGERIKRAQEKSGILDQIKDVRGGVLSQFVSKDPFGIRGNDDKDVIDVEFEVVEDVDS